MTDPNSRTERTARVMIAVLGVIAAALGTLTAYFAATKSDVVQQRDDVRSDVSTLTTQQSSLEEQVARLKRDNADLRGQLTSASASSVSTSDAADVATRRLSVPLPQQGVKIGVFLTRGLVKYKEGADFYYEREASTGLPQLTAGRWKFSTAPRSATIGQNQCSQLASNSASNQPFALLGPAVICSLSDEGVSRLTIAAPQKDGRLKISQTYWPKPS